MTRCRNGVRFVDTATEVIFRSRISQSKALALRPNKFTRPGSGSGRKLIQVQIPNTHTAKIKPSTARPLIVHPVALSVSVLSTAVSYHMTVSCGGIGGGGGTVRAAFLAASLWVII